VAYSLLRAFFPYYSHMVIINGIEPNNATHGPTYRARVGYYADGCVVCV